MINILICSAIVLCFALIAFGAIFLNYEVSKEKKEAKQESFLEDQGKNRIVSKNVSNILSKLY